MGSAARFHPLVASDLAEAIAWYESRAEGLGDRFRAAVDARFDDVENSPEAFPRAFADLDVRFAKAARFPYLILYRIRNGIPIVLAVFHSASDPAKWRQRAADAP